MNKTRPARVGVACALVGAALPWIFGTLLTQYATDSHRAISGLLALLLFITAPPSVLPGGWNRSDVAELCLMNAVLWGIYGILAEITARRFPRMVWSVAVLPAVWLVVAIAFWMANL